MESNLVVILSFLLFCALVGFLQGKGVRTFEAYALSRGQFSSLTIFLTIVASFIGGGSVLGTISKSYTHGFYPFVALLGFGVQLLLTAFVLSKHIGKYNQVMTIGDILDTVYGSWVKKIVTLFWLCFAMGVLSVQIKAMGETISFYTSLSVTVSIFLSAFVLVFYCTLGGIKAVIYTDLLQALIMFVMLPVILFFLIQNFIGYDLFVSKISYAICEQPASWNKGALFSAFVGFVAGDALIPPVMQRVLIASRADQVRNTFFWGALGVVFCILIAALIGIVLSGTPFPDGVHDTTGLLLNVIPPIFRPFVVLSIIAVIISSADSYLNASAVQVSRDLLGTKRLSACRFITLLMGGAATGLALYTENLFDMLLFTYKFWGPIVIVPLVAVIVGRPLTENQLKVSGSLSIVTVGFWWGLGMELKTDISDVVVGISVSLLYYMLVHYFTKSEVKMKEI